MMKLFLALTCLAIAGLAISCTTTDKTGETPPPAESAVYTIAPGTP